MQVSKYLDWMVKQDPEFIYEICGILPIKDKFKDYRFRSITLEELQQLDEKYINCESEIR